MDAVAERPGASSRRKSIKGPRDAWRGSAERSGSSPVRLMWLTYLALVGSVMEGVIGWRWRKGRGGEKKTMVFQRGEGREARPQRNRKWN